MQAGRDLQLSSALACPPKVSVSTFLQRHKVSLHARVPFLPSETLFFDRLSSFLSFLMFLPVAQQISSKILRFLNVYCKLDWSLDDYDAHKRPEETRNNKLCCHNKGWSNALRSKNSFSILTFPWYLPKDCCYYFFKHHEEKGRKN